MRFNFNLGVAACILSLALGLFLGSALHKGGHKQVEDSSFILIDKNECDALILNEKARCGIILKTHRGASEIVRILTLSGAIVNKIYQGEDSFLESSELWSVVSQNQKFSPLLAKHNLKATNLHLSTSDQIIQKIDKQILRENYFGIMLVTNKNSTHWLLLQVRGFVERGKFDEAMVMSGKLDQKKYQDIVQEIRKISVLLGFINDLSLAIKESFGYSEAMS